MRSVLFFFAEFSVFGGTVGFCMSAINVVPAFLWHPAYVLKQMRCPSYRGSLVAMDESTDKRRTAITTVRGFGKSQVVSDRYAVGLGLAAILILCNQLPNISSEHGFGMPLKSDVENADF